MPTLVEGYQAWLQKITEGEVDKSEAKCLKRLFNTAEPPLYYLIEQKRALIGHLIESPIPQPQQSGLPFYLGSLEDARQTLHPRDPMFLLLPHVSVRQVPQALEFEIDSDKGKLRFTSELLKSFARTAEHSRTLADSLRTKGFALREVFPILLDTLLRSHWAPDNQRLLVPLHIARDTKARFLVAGSIVFVAQRGVLDRCYDREGTGLLYFLQRECEQLQKGRRGVRVGTLTLGNIRRRELGIATIGTLRFQVMLHAFFEFVKAVQREAPHGAREWRRFTAETCIEEFSELLSLAEPIEGGKIARHLPEHRDRKARYYINQRWIFVAGSQGVLTHTIDKFK